MRATASATPKTRPHGIGDDLIGGTVAVDASTIEHHEARGEQRSEVEIVQDGNYGRAAVGPGFGRGDHVELMAEVEIRGRLVEQRHARAVRRFSACECRAPATA
jgi:hypothetical protein